MQLTFDVDRQAAIRGGHNTAGTVTVDIDVAALPQDDRDELAAAVNSAGEVRGWFAPDDYRRGQIVPCSRVTATGPTAVSLLAAVRESKAAAEKAIADRRGREDEELARVDAAAAEALAGRKTRVASYSDYFPFRGADSRRRVEWQCPVPDVDLRLNYARHRDGELRVPTSPEWVAWVRELDAVGEVSKAAALAAEQAAVDADIVAKAEKATRVRVGREKLSGWVCLHGSDLAKARLEEGYDCWVSAAHDDYVAFHAARVAGDLVAADDPDGDPEVEDRKCPSLPEIAALRAVRARIGEGDPIEADLIRVKYSPEKDADEYDYDPPEPVTRTELRLTVTCPDGYEDVACYLIPGA